MAHIPKFAWADSKFQEQYQRQANEHILQQQATELKSKQKLIGLNVFKFWGHNTDV